MNSLNRRRDGRVANIVTVTLSPPAVLGAANMQHEVAYEGASSLCRRAVVIAAEKKRQLSRLVRMFFYSKRRENIIWFVV